MRRVARETLCPKADKAYLAYADAEVEYAPGRWLMRPRDVAKLLHAVKSSGRRARAGHRRALCRRRVPRWAMGLTVVRQGA